MDKPNPFRDWMDARGLSAREVGARLHVEEQTIRHWRSKGVPERRMPHVQNMMATWDDTAPDLVEIRLQTLVIRTDPDQFRRWESAARRSGDDHLEDWARSALESMAAEENVKPFALAAEEPAEWKKNPADGHPNADTTPPPKRDDQKDAG